MDEIRARLKNCFAAVFPRLPESKLESAHAGTTEGWDSVAMVTLVSVVEEEFGCTIELDEIDTLNSFRSFEQRLSGGDRDPA